MDINGGKILLQAGEQVLEDPIIIGSEDTPDGDIVIEGQGSSTVLKRGADMPTGKGLLNIYGRNIILKNFVIDGDVLSPTGIDVGSMGDPIADALTANTSIWVHPGAANIRFENVIIRHTGGYAILLDSRTDDITNVEIIGCTIENSRSQVITYSGTPGGGWTGGIFAKMLATSGTSGAVNGLKIQGCTFRRISGIGFWSHSNDFQFQNKNLIISGCTFEDVARDGVEPGNWQGGNITSNTFYRVGHMATDDTSDSTPNWPTGAPNAVAIDSTGYNRDFTISGNSIRNTNGTGCDLDGMFSSTIANNNISVDDGVSGYGPGGIGNYSTGIQPGNTYYKLAASNLVISGNTIKGMGNAALSLSNLKDSQVTYNNIIHPSGAALPPIVLFCKPGYDNGVYTTGNTDSGYRSHGNVIANNRVLYSGSRHVVEEIALAGGVDYAFKSSDVNRTFHNIVTGSTPGEFKKSSDSSSFAGFDLFTNDGTSASADVTRIQREGTTTTATTKTYKIVGGTKTQLQQLSDDAFLNLSVGGAVKTGVFATGSRSTAAFADCIVTGKLAADGFLSLTDTTLDSDANLLPDTYGLLKYDSATKTFKKSTSVSAGARVWTDFAASVAGSDKQVQFNDAGSLAGNASLTFDKTAKVLTATGTTGTASIVAATSYIQSAEGFYSPGTSSTTVNIPSGGVTSLSHVLIRNDASQSLYFVRNSGSNQRTFALGINGSGNLLLTDETATATRLTINSSGQFTFGSTVNIDQSGNISATGTVQAAGVNVTGSSYNSLQAPTAGLYVGLGVTTDQALYAKSYASSTMNAPGAGYGGLAHKTGTQYWVYNGSSWTAVDFATVGGGVTSLTAGTGISVSGSTGAVTVSNSGVTSLTGTTNQVSVSGSTGSVTLSLPQSIHTGATPTFSTLTISSSASNAISVTGSVSAAGFAASGTATNQIQAASGGVTAKWLVGTTSLTLAADTSSSAGLSSAGQGRLYFDSSTNKFRVSENGGAYVDLLSATGVTSLAAGTGISISGSTGSVTVTNSGVTSLTGTTNQVSVSGSTGGVTLSLPQNIHTSATPTFSTLTISSSASNAISVTGAVSAAGFAASGTATNQIQAASGGVTAKYLIGTTSLTLAADTSSNAGLSSAGQGRLYFDSSTNKFRVSENGGSYVDLLAATGVTSLTAGTGISVSGSTGSVTISNSGVTALTGSTGLGVSASTGSITLSNTGVTSLAGTTNQVSVSGSTGAVTLSLPQSIHTGATPTFSTLTISSSASNAIAVTGSVSAAGFAASGTATNQIQAASGGVTAKYLIGTTSLTLAADTSSNAGLSSAGQGRLYFDSSTSKFRVSENGGSYVDLLAATGVTSLTAGSGISVSGSTGAVTISNAGVTSNVAGTGVSVSSATGASTISIGQAVGTSSNVQFATVATTSNTVIGATSASKGRLAVVGSQGYAYSGFNIRCTARFSGDANNAILLDTTGATNASGYTRGLYWGYAADDLGFCRFANNDTSILYDMYIAPAGTVMVNNTVDDSSGAKLQVTGFVSATTGYYTASSATDAFKATTGGITARYLIGTRSLTLAGETSSNAGLSSSGQGRVYFDSSSNKFRVSENGGSYVDLVGSTTQWTTTGSDIYYATGKVGVGTSSPVQALHVYGASGTQATSGTTQNGIMRIASNATNTLDIGLSNASPYGAWLQVTNVGSLNTTYPLVLNPNGGNVGINTASPAAALHVLGNTSREVARFQGSADTSNNRNFVSMYTTNPAYWWELSCEDSAGNGTTNGLAFRERSGSGSSVSRLYLTQGGNILVGTQTDDSTGAKVQVSGFISSTSGLYSSSTSYQAVNIPNGGVYARSGHFEKFIHIAGNSGVPTATSGTSVPANGQFYYDTSLSKFRAYEGGAWKDMISSSSGGITSINSQSGPTLTIAAGTGISVSSSSNTITVTNSGLTSLSGGTGVSVSSATGASTINIGQPVGVSSSVTFGTVTSSGVVQSSATGASITFQNSNSNFSVDGNGNISSAASVNILGSYKTNGTTVIDSARNGSLATLTTSGAVNSTVTGSSIGLQVNGGNFQVDGNGNCSGGGSANFVGGYKVSGTTAINSSNQFVGNGVSCPSYGISASGFNPYNGGVQYTGQNWNITLNGGATFSVNGSGSYTTIIVKGGSIVSAS